LLYQVIICRNAEGEDFVAQLHVRKEGSSLIGRFSEAPRLRMRLRISESGAIADCTGDCYVFIGYKVRCRFCSLFLL
jgi:hypothetical protein